MTPAGTNYQSFMMGQNLNLKKMIYLQFRLKFQMLLPLVKREGKEVIGFRLTEKKTYLT